jgi:anaerobic magnesium-protoporphyrin IX monomethyl ester cyclase
MKKVLIAQSYFYKLDTKQWQTKQPYPPLGTLLAASVVRSADFDPKVFDVGLIDDPSTISVPLQEYSPDYFIIYDDGFNYLTKMCLTVMREAAFTMAALAKAQNCTVIICSSDSTDHYEKYFEHGVDYVVRGEGEETLKELLTTLEKKEDPNTVLGIAFRRDDETCVTPTRPVMRQLDSLPMPAWDLIDLKPYQEIWQKHHGYFSLNIATTRGCPFKCNWCAKPIYGNRYNSRSPKLVVDEIEYLLKNFQPAHFWMCDDIFGLKPRWIQEFRDEVKKRSLKFKYKIQSRVDLLLQEDTTDALAESGAETIWVGAESGSQKILDAMDKGTTVEQIYEATRLLKRKGINTAFFLQFGYPGEGKKEIDETLKMVLELMPEEIGISVSYPLPGTKFYENVKLQLGAKQNWTDSDELAMMFESTFNSDYYKKLHRYVHSQYRIKKGFDGMRKIIRSPLSYNYKDARAALAALYHLPFSLLLRKSLQKEPSAAL